MGRKSIPYTVFANLISWKSEHFQFITSIPFSAFNEAKKITSFNISFNIKINCFGVSHYYIIWNSSTLHFWVKKAMESSLAKLRW